MATIEDVQRELRRLGHDLGQDGPADDGVSGELREASLLALMEILAAIPTPEAPTPPEGTDSDPEDPFDVAAEALTAEQAAATRPVDTLLVCSTDTPEGLPVTVEMLRAQLCGEGKLTFLPWHYVIGLDGAIAAATPEMRIAPTVDGHNTGKIAIGYVGGRTLAGAGMDTRTEAQKRALLALAKALLRKYPATAAVKGANALPRPADDMGVVPPFDPSANPGFDVATDPLGVIIAPAVEESAAVAEAAPVGEPDQV